MGSEWMCKNMQINKFKFFVITFILIFTHLYTYYIAKEKTNFNNFLQEIHYSFSLLSALEDKKVDTVKVLLSSDINRVFIDASKSDNITKYTPLCKYMYSHDLLILNQYDDPNYQVTLGQNKIKKLCFTLTNKNKGLGGLRGLEGLEGLGVR